MYEAISPTQQGVDHMHMYDSNLWEKWRNYNSEVIRLRKTVS